MTHSQSVLHLAVSTGEAMLINGAEIYRVHDTVSHIIEAYGITDYQVYVLSNGIFSTVHEGEEDSVTLVRHIPLGSIHLGRISALNALSREICEKKLPLSQAYHKLAEYKSLPETRNSIKILACGIGSFSFCYLLGGTWADSLCALVLGFILQLFINTMQKKKTSRFFTNIIGSAIVAAGSILFSVAGLPVSPSHVIIGGIILLFPGVIFTTAIRDFFGGDHLSGAIHLIDALLTSVCIACGAGATVLCYQFLGGGTLTL